MIYHNNEKTLSVEIPDNFESNIVATSMSGGADSSILAFLIAKQIIDFKLDVKILPFTRCRNYPASNPKTWNATRAKIVIEKITELLGQNIFLDHYIDYPPGIMKLEEENNYVRKLHEKMYNQYRCKHFMYGVTCNPSIEEMTKNNFLEERMPSRDQGVNLTANISNPFLVVDKKFIRDLYEQTGTMDSIFPLTFSCEGEAHETNNYSSHCEKCWWCRERKWAFGKYI
jgi:hypothetical protein